MYLKLLMIQKQVEIFKSVKQILRWGFIVLLAFMILKKESKAQSLLKDYKDWLQAVLQGQRIEKSGSFYQESLHKSKK